MRIYPVEVTAFGEAVADQFRRRGMKHHELISYHTLSKCSDEKLRKFFASDVRADLFVDSGAFSAKTKGVVIDLDRYIDFLKRRGSEIQVYAGLDVIGDPVATERNILYMEEAGLEPVSCFHMGEPQVYLDKMAEKSEYIALGGLAGGVSSRSQITQWLDEVFYKDGDLRYPGLKIHGFGITGLYWLRRYPWFSVDSTAWIRVGAYGQIWILSEDRRKWKQVVVSEGKGRDEEGAKFENCSDLDREKILALIKERGFTLDGIRESHFDRHMFNLMGLIELEEQLEWDGIPVGLSGPAFVTSTVLQKKKATFSGRRIEGEGNPNADIFLVGMCPGKDEARKGRPFVGRSGKLLDQMLLEAGLKREDVYLDNTVPYFIGDRDPTSEEIEACHTRLEEALNRVKPKVVVPLGNTALLRIEGLTGITKFRGRKRRLLSGIWSIPTFHPAKILRDPTDRQTVVQDLKYAQAIVEGKTGEVDYRIISDRRTLEWALDRLFSVSHTAFDVETDSLDFVRASLLGVGFSWKPGTGIYIPLLVPEGETPQGGKVDLRPFWNGDQKFVRRDLEEVLKGEARKTAHNAKFDINVLRQSLGVKVKNCVFDTQNADSLLDENRRHGLSFLSMRYQDLARYADDPIFFGVEEDVGFAKAPLEALGMKCCEDCDATLRLAGDLWGELEKDEGLKRLYVELLDPVQKVLIETEFHGVKVDRDYVKDLRKRYTERMKELLKEIYLEAGEEFNVRSHTALSRILFGKLKLKSIKKSKKTKKPSTNKDVMEQLAKVHKMPRMIVEYRSLAHKVSTWFDGIEQRLDENDRVHTSYQLHWVKTGRLSSKDPNLQNVPRGKEIRGMFVAEDGYRLISADYSLAELRWAALLSGDKNLQEAFASGDDMHRRTASEILSRVLGRPVPLEEVTKEQRQQGKNMNFAMTYGASPEGLAENFGVDLEYAKKLYNGYFAAFPKLKTWQTKSFREVREKGVVRNAFGRYRRLPMAKDTPRGTPLGMPHVEKQGLNFIIQSVASDFCVYSATRVMRVVAERNWDVKLILTVHDSLVFECREDLVSEVVPVVREEMEKPVFGFDPGMKVDIQVSKRWEGEELEV